MLSLSCPAAAQEVDFTPDFEEGNLRGWTQTGDAFRYQPTLGNNPTARRRGQSSNHQGQYWIGTFEKYQGRRGQTPGDVQEDQPRGTLTSNYFIVPPGTLTFLIGGGSRFQTRVELYSQDPDATGLPFATGKDTETMSRVTWNLTPHAGKRLQIRIVDNSSDPWGHINVDDFRFFPSRGELEPPKISGTRKEERIVPPAAPEYVLRTTVQPTRIRIGESVTITANLNPADDNAEYRFDFGDQSSSPWIRQPVITHSYGSPGIFNVSVTARIARSAPALLATSRTEQIIVPGEQIRVTVEDPFRGIEVVLQPSRDQAQPGERIVFVANLNRPAENPQFNFLFGDGEESGWMSAPRTRYEYSEEGFFSASVIVRQDRRILAQSQEEGIRIAEDRVIPESRMSLFLHADPDSAAIGKTINFTAHIEPPDQEAEYRFFFGDGTQTEWSRNPGAQHAYTQSETYNAYVTARVGQGPATESFPISITITSTSENGSLLKIILIVVAAIIVAGIGYFLLRPIKIPKIIPHGDSGVQSIDSEQALNLEHEIQLRVFPDQGSQEIVGNSLVSDEIIEEEEK